MTDTPEETTPDTEGETPEADDQQNNAPDTPELSYEQVQQRQRDGVMNSTSSFSNRLQEAVTGDESDEQEGAIVDFIAKHEALGGKGRKVLEKLGVPADRIDEDIAAAKLMTQGNEFKAFATRRSRIREIKKELAKLQKDEPGSSLDSFIRAYVVGSDDNMLQWFFEKYEGESLEAFGQTDKRQAAQKIEALLAKVVADLGQNEDDLNEFMSLSEQHGGGRFTAMDPVERKKNVKQQVEQELTKLYQVAGYGELFKNMPKEAIDAYFGKVLDSGGQPGNERNMKALFEKKKTLAEVLPHEFVRVRAIVNHKEHEWYGPNPPEDVQKLMDENDARVVQLTYREDDDVQKLASHISYGQSIVWKLADGGEVTLEGTGTDEFTVVGNVPDDFKQAPMKYLAMERPVINLTTAPDTGTSN